MTPSDQTPKLPTWIFIVTDLALLGAAGLIAWSSPRPFTDGTTFSIVLCLIIGAIAGLVPIVAHYERVKNETLDDRQRALEALSRTISSSAEQISIAATGLHAIAELSLKNLRHAEHLPQKLQEKIAEFQAALAASNDTEKEELEKELVALRSTESERLESVSDKISKAAADLTTLDAASQKNLTASSEVIAHASAAALTQFSSATSAAVAHAVTTATAALTAAAGRRGLLALRGRASAGHDETADQNRSNERERTKQTHHASKAPGEFGSANCTRIGHDRRRRRRRRAADARPTH